MTIKSSGSSLSFSEIEAEFGANGSRSLGSYRTTQNVGQLSNLPLDSGIPTSGQIKFSDFYSKKLNHVVDLYSIGNSTTRQNAKDRWSNGNVHIVGSTKTGKTQPPDTVEDRVIINVNATIASAKGTQTHCALRTGNWDSNTTLEIEIGTSGKLYGSGGNGGTGVDKSSIFGTTYGDSGWFASGGGGGGRSSVASAGTASQGGGSSGKVDNARADDAQKHTGGGGGGGGYNGVNSAQQGGDGGSGIVIVIAS